MKTSTAIAIFFMLFILCVLVGSYLTQIPEEITIHSTAIAKSLGLGVYETVNCTNPVTSINWGIIEPGQTAIKTVFLRNEGNAPCTILSDTEQHEPQAIREYMVFTCSVDNQTLTPNQPVPCNFSLYIRNNITDITEFSFDIILSTT